MSWLWWLGLAIVNGFVWLVTENVAYLVFFSTALIISELRRP